jgi:ribosomal-protein-serine acetyltransferase
MPANRILIDAPDRLETARLTLRVPCEGEGASIHPTVLESANELAAWMPWANPTPTVESTEVWCRRMRARFVQREEAAFVLRLKDADQVIKRDRSLNGTGPIRRVNWTCPV